MENVVADNEVIYKLSFGSAYTKSPIGTNDTHPRRMFARTVDHSGKIYAHTGVPQLKADCNIAVNEGLKQLKDGGYIAVTVKVVNV